jgi:hypothetical protein
LLIEARDAAAVLGRGVSFTGDVARVTDARLTLADNGDSEPVFPAVAEVVEVVDDGAARPQHVA